MRAHPLHQTSLPRQGTWSAIDIKNKNKYKNKKLRLLKDASLNKIPQQTVLKQEIRTDNIDSEAGKVSRLNLEKHRSQGHAVSKKVKGKVSQCSYDNAGCSQ